MNTLAGRIGTIACAALLERRLLVPPCKRSGSVQLGIDVLVAHGFKELDGQRVGLITNHTGVDSTGVIDGRAAAKSAERQAGGPLQPRARNQRQIRPAAKSATRSMKNRVCRWSASTAKVASHRASSWTASTRWFSTSRTSAARFYTYPSTMGLAMEEAAKAGKRFVVLDRPNPIGGDIVEGPLIDAGRESFVAFYHVPVRHGMTLGELARMYAAEKKLDVDLVVVPMEGWRRSDYLYDTGLTWINPSPNMRSLKAAVLYPGIGLLETTNVSVGRGTDTPFEVLGAPWIRERELAAAINAADPPGVRVVPIRFTPTASKFSGENCGGVNFIITDWSQFRSLDLGFVVAHALRTLYPDDWKSKGLHQTAGKQGRLRSDYGRR